MTVIANWIAGVDANGDPDQYDHNVAAHWRSLGDNYRNGVLETIRDDYSLINNRPDLNPLLRAIHD